MKDELSSRVTRWAWVLIVVAVLFRAWMAPDARFTGDESYFWATARNTATFDARPVYGPSMTDSPAYHPGPLFYYLMALPQRLGNSPLFGSMAIVLLHGLAGWLLFCLVRRARGDRAGLIALGLFTFAPWDVLYGDRIWLSCMAPVWGSLILYAAARARDSGPWQGALLFFAATCPQLHMSAPIVWAAAGLLLILNPPERWSRKALLAGCVLTFVAYGPPLYHELTHDFVNTKAILTHAGGKIEPQEVMQHPLRVMLYAIFYGSSEIGYHFGRGYWTKFDALQTYLTVSGWKTLFASRGGFAANLSLVSIMVAFIGWCVALFTCLRSTTKALLSRSRMHLNPADRFTLAMLVALSSAALLLMGARKGFFPHYTNLLMPMILFPIAAGIDRLYENAVNRQVRGLIVMLVLASMLSMGLNSHSYYKQIDRLNGVTTTRILVGRVMEEKEKVAVRFEGFQNLFAWQMIAQTEYKRPLNVSSSGKVHYLIKNRSVHTGEAPENGEVIRGVLVVRTHR